jgi:hypothetical protein
MADEFDRRLAQRLRRYEARIPDEGAEPLAPGARGVSWGAVAAAAAGAVVVGAVLGVVLLNRGDGPVGAGSPSPSDSAIGSPASSPQASATASPASQPASPTEAPSVPPAPAGSPVGLHWRETAIFSDAAGPAMVHDVANGGSGLVAVGVQYLEALPNVGPTPQHVGRIWRSTDARSWEAVPPADMFANVTLEHVIVRPDGTYVAIGAAHEVSDGQLLPIGAGSWESADGRTWTETGLFPGLAYVDSTEGGARGYLALLLPADGPGAPTLLFATDAETWESVPITMTAIPQIGAGSEGFVVLGGEGPEGGPIEPRGIASADGREWLDAVNPPADAVGLVPLGPDWVATSWTVTDSLPDQAPTWLSANGLEWAEHGSVPLATEPIEGGECREYPSGLTSADEWLVLATTLSYPCSEGGFVVHGTQRISTDGAAWEDLPFPSGTPGQSRSGSTVLSAAAVDGNLVLVGESNGRAAFWIGEAP